MGEIFLKLLNMSITASWLILVVLSIRLFFRKMPKWVNCLLWGVVAVRLIVPFSIESSLSLQPSAQPIQSSTVTSGEVSAYVPSVDSNLSIVENTINPVLAETFSYSAEDSVAPLQVVTEVAGIVWMIGMILLLVFALGSMIRLSILVRESVVYKDNIYICDGVKSPFILGIVRPRIYLSSSLAEDEIEYIVAHEKAHLNRKDHLWKPLGYLLLCIYWFNPLCWIAYVMLCKDIELACDEKVIRDMNFEDKKEYSRVLLSCAIQRRLVMACPLAFGEVGVKERVKTVLNYKKPAFWITLIAILVCVIVSMCFLTNPEKKMQEETILEEIDKELPVNAHVLSDIDSNGQPEYTLNKGEENNVLEFYYNNELIYIHEDILPVDMGETYFLDLDRDGQEEIVLTMYPRVNSMPLIEYAVLKNEEGVWEKLEMIQGENLLDNQFPINIFNGEGVYEAVISCEGLEKEISVDLTNHILRWKEDTETPELAAYYVKRYEQDFQAPAGNICGEVCSWGIWNIEPTEYGGYPCLAATHGIQGFGKEDLWGMVQVLFDYSTEGRIRFLDLTFTPSEEVSDTEEVEERVYYGETP